MRFCQNEHPTIAPTDDFGGVHAAFGDPSTPPRGPLDPAEPDLHAKAIAGSPFLQSVKMSTQLSSLRTISAVNMPLQRSICRFRRSRPSPGDRTRITERKPYSHTRWTEIDAVKFQNGTRARALNRRKKERGNDERTGPRTDERIDLGSTPGIHRKRLHPGQAGIHRTGCRRPRLRGGP